MTQTFETTIKVSAQSQDNAKKKIAVVNNLLQNLDDATFEQVFNKIQKNPTALTKVKNFINFL